MKLLFILPEYLPQSGGGIITFYRMWLPRLSALGHEVRVLVGSAFTQSDDSAPISIDGVTVEMLSRRRFDAHLSEFSHYAALPALQRHLAAAWALFEQAEHGKGADLVEVTDWGLLFIPWVIEQVVPTVVQMHGSCGQIDLHDPVAGEELQGHLIRLIEKVGVSHASAVQSCSRVNAAFWQLQSGRAVGMLPVAYRRPQGLRARKRGSRGLVVGRMQRWKGPVVLAQALAQLGGDAPQVDWVGRDMPHGDRACSTAQVMAATFPQVWNRTLLHKPAQSADAVADLQAGASFVVVPSAWDVFNFTCVEAMAAGAVVICSTGAGASEWIEDGVNGFRFEREDAASLVEALRRFLTLDEGERHAVAERGRQTVAEVFDAEAVVAMRLRAYADTVNTARRALPPGDWLRSAATPQSRSSGALRFLDHLPLRHISRYVLKRAFRKARES